MMEVKVKMILFKNLIHIKFYNNNNKIKNFLKIYNNN